MNQNKPPESAQSEQTVVTLPSHAQGELHILSSLLGHGRESADRVAPLLSESDFHFARHRAIYSAIMRVYAEGSEILPATVIEMLSRKKSAIMGPEGLAELERMAENPPTIRGAVPTAKLLLNYRVRRDMIVAAQEVAKIASDLTIQQDTVLTRSVATIQQAAVGLTSLSRTESAPVIGAKVMHEIRDRASRGDSIKGIPTGLRTWDLQVSGIVPRELNVIAGATGMGKTAAMLTMVDGTTAAGSPAIVFSLEMENSALWHRALSMDTGIDSRRISVGDFSDSEWVKVESANARWSSKPLEMNDWAGMTVKDIEAAVREFTLRVKGDLPAIVYIDFAQIIANLDERNQNEATKIQKNLYALREMVKNLNLGLVLMAQLNRNVDSRDDKRPRVGDVADSAGIAKSADTLTMLYRPAYYAPPQPPTEAGLTDEQIIMNARLTEVPPDEAEWIVEKGRNGGRRTLKMTYHPTRTKFTCGGLDMRGF